MKKVKTIILSLLIVVGTAFMSACSCGGSAGEGPVVPEREITISCNEYVGGSVTITSKPESKELDIKCNVGDQFTIEYLLSPDDTTTTRVRWEIADTDVVKTENTRLTEYSKTIKEKVTFVANNKGDTTIKFITESNKTAVANVVVGTRLANLPTLGRVELDAINYNPNNSVLSWTEPTKMVTTLGQVVDISDEAKADISHYEVAVTNLDTNKTETLNIAKNVRKLTTLENGIRYSVTIKPIGGSFAVASGAVSDPFKFCQLAPATNLKNNNGELSFQSPKYSEDHDVYSTDNVKTDIDDKAGNSPVKINCSQLKDYGSIRIFTISVKSFPALYDETLGYGRVVNKEGEIVDDLRYYPSNKCPSISVVKLPTPTLSLENYQGTLTINGISTEATMGTNLIIDKSVNQNYSDNNAFYQLNIYRYDVDSMAGAPLHSAQINPSISKTYNLSNVLASALNGGNEFSIQVQFLGDNSSTISSNVVKMKITVPVNSPSSSWAVDNNYLITPSNNNYAGLELYFVDELNKTIITKTVEKNPQTNSINLQELAVTPGTYKLFGRFIGNNLGDNTGTIIGDVSPNPFDISGGVPVVSDDMNIYIPQGISSYNVNSSGDFVITKPSANNNNSIYQLSLAPVSGGGERQLILVNEEDTNIDAYKTYFNVTGNSDGGALVSLATYTLEGSQIKFNLMTAIQNSLVDGDAFFDSLFTEEYKYSFTTKAYLITEDDKGNQIEIEGIDSVPSTESTISRLACPQNITFDNNIISFAKIEGATSYSLFVTVGEDSYEVSGIRASGDRVQIDITTTNIKGSTTTKLSSILNNISVAGNVSITYKAIGSNASAGGKLVLDSPTNTNYYEVTSILKDYIPTLDVNGNISWTTPYSLTGEVSSTPDPEPTEPEGGEDPSTSDASTYKITNSDVKYVIYFYNSNGEAVDSITLIPTILGDGDSLASGYCSVIPKGTQGNDRDILSANILNKIQSILSDNSSICSIEIKEYISTKFMGAGTTRYYISTLAQVQPSYGIDGDNIITWDAIDGADSYDVFVNDSTTPINVRTNSILVSELCTNRGVYTIRVMAKADNEEGVGREDNPFYIYGAEGSVDVNVISAQILASVNNIAISQVSNFDSNFIIWNNICLSGTYYTIRINGNDFILTSDAQGNPSVLPTADGQKPFTTSTIKLILTSEMYELLNGGNNEIVIIPTINFADTGYILVDAGNLPVNNLRKINTPSYYHDTTTITTVDGNLVIYTDEDVEDLIIKIRTDGQQNFEQISTANYEIIKDNSNATKRTIIFNISEFGNLYIRIKAVKKDTFYSDYLMYMVDKVEMVDDVEVTTSVEAPITKLATVGDFSRSGDGWFEWTAVDGVTSYELVIWKTTFETTPPTPELPEEDNQEPGVSEVTEGGEPEGGEEDDPIIEDDNTQNVTTPKTIRFTVVKNGDDSYTCQVEDGIGNGDVVRFKYINGKFRYIFDEQVLFDGKGSGDYHFVIRPLTTTNGYLNGSNSQETTITKLNNDTTISIVDGIISISGYNQTGENLPIGISYTITPYTELSVDDGDSGEVGTSETTTTTGTIGKGTIIWNNDYENNKTVTIDLLSVTDGTNPTFIYTAYDLTHYNFKIQIKYLGDGSVSVDSDVTSDISLERFETTKISTIDGVVAIKSVDGASNYLVEISDGTNTNYVNVLGTDDTTFMTELIAETNGFKFSANVEYTLKVQVKGSKLSSAWSEPFKVIKLGSPTEPIDGKGIYIDDDGNGGYPKVYWKNNILNTYSIGGYYYRIIYTNKIGPDSYQQMSGVNGVETDISNATAQDLLTNLPVGTYYIRLRTNGTTSNDGEIGYLNSDYTTGIPVTYVSETSGLKVSNGMISWTPVESALYYKVSFEYGSNKNVTISTNQTYVSTDIIPSDVSSIVNITVTTVEESATGIVTDYIAEGEEYTANKLSVYKPSTAGDFKIINGMLSWTIDLADIKEFATIQGITLPNADNGNEGGGEGDGETELSEVETPVTGTTTTDVSEDLVKYIIKKINYNEKKDANAAFDLQVSFLWQANLKMNAKSQTITPDFVELISETGSVISNAIDNDFTEAYWTNGYKLRYYYDVVTDRYNGQKPENPQKPLAGYVSGNYSLLVSLTGNSGDATGSDKPVLSSSYTSPIEAYKLLSPDTYTRFDASGVKYDISTGNIYWTPVNNGLAGGGANYEYYAVEVFNRNTNERHTATLSLSEATKLNDNYYYVHLLDLFAVNSIKESGDERVILRSDTKYEIRVYATGTIDSDNLDPALSTGSQLYLNSNSIDYINELSILDVPAAPVMDSNNVIWTPAATSTLTRVRIYGPFTSSAVEGSPYKISADEIASMEWQDSITSDILATITPYETIDFGFDADGGRDSVYTLTNKFIGGIASNPKYTAGGYVITFQEIGDDHGVIDSVISQPYHYYKLGQTTRVELGSGDYKGMFVWDAVDYANAYKVQLYKLGNTEDEDKTPDELISTRYTNEYFEVEEDDVTKRRFFYDLPDFEYDVTDKFYIIVQACNVADSGMQYLNIDNNNVVLAHQKDSWFMGDDVMSQAYSRLDVPTSFNITNSGNISWARIENAGTYTIIYNDGTTNSNVTLETVSGNVENSHTILSNIQGKFGIRVRTIVSENASLLNSRRSYTTPLMKLFNPNPRINTEGNLTWGVEGQTGSDATFYSQLIINSDDENNKIVIKGDADESGNIYDIDLTSLYIKYYTDITQISTEVALPEEDEENPNPEVELPRVELSLVSVAGEETPEDQIKGYSYENDLIKYPLGEEQFSMQYIGNNLKITVAEGENNMFMISSEIENITAYKLPAPTNIDFAEIDLSGETQPVNRLYWNPVANASDYNVFRFAVAVDGGYQTTYSKSLVQNVAQIADKYREADGKCYFDVSDMLVPGATNYFFVQSVGGTIDNAHYINSSYSNKKTIDVPSTPSELAIINGEMNWVVDTPNVYNMAVILEYSVSDINSIEEYKAYWNRTSTEYNGEDKIILSSEIKSRTVSYDNANNKVNVVERILLEANKYNNVTPTYYKLNAIAKYTKFTLFALAGTNINNPTFKSLDYVVINNYNFAMFASGDGSEYNPYIVTSEIQLNNIKYFKERAFKLDPVEVNGQKKITLGNDWKALLGDFTGSIDGNGTTIANYRMALTEVSTSNYIMAFVENNLGTIENITFDMLGVGVVSQESSIKVSTIAVTNTGTINNITVNGTNVYNNTAYHLYVEAKDQSDKGIKVGGLVVENKGTIISANINMSIYAIGQDDKKVSVGGIAYSANGGTISNSSFIGDIKGQLIGGLVYEANNVVSITNCTVGSEGRIAKLTGQAYYGGYGKEVDVGGLIGVAVATNRSTNISNCKTYVNIVLDVKQGQSSKIYCLGGMIANVDENNSYNIAISNSETSISYSYIGNADINGLATRIIAYLFSSSSKVVCSGECYYKNRTTGTFIISNDIPNGVYQKTN